MSYEIIKRIRIDKGKVLIRYCSNNVYPKDYLEAESHSLTKILKEQGQEVLDLEILKAYESGCFQRGSNKYTRALLILRHMPEYDLFNWRNNGKEYEEAEKRRKTEAFDILLKKALAAKLPRDKFIVTKDYFGAKVYLWKLTKKHCQWRREREKAKTFRYEAEAAGLKHCFTNSENWIVEKIK